MQLAPTPIDEVLRLDNLLSFDILDTKEEQYFDDLAKLTALVCNCKYALVSFIDSDRQWFKARSGIAITESPRDTSFCGHTILSNDVMVVNNCQKDERFFDNPLVTNGYKMAFYAGAPIISAKGYKLGTVCGIDDEPKAFFSQEQQIGLKIIAAQVTALLELGVKNKIAERKNVEIVAEEKMIIKQTLTAQDEEKTFIADELHENFAQTLAATKLYLDFAGQSADLGPVFLKKCQENILQIINDIKALSKSMLPTTFQNANFLGFIQDMLTAYGNQHGKVIKFTHKGKLDCYDSRIGLSLFRIIQYQLKNAHNCGAKKIAITIKTDNHIKLTFTDNGRTANEQEPERKMLLRHIRSRIELVKGCVETGTDKEGNNVLKIQIPLVQELEW